MDTSFLVVGGIVAVCLTAYPLLWFAGLAWSRGFHKGKREFVEELVCKSTSSGKMRGNGHG